MEQRVAHVVDKHLMPLGLQTDREALCQAAESFYNKLTIADRYKPGAKIKGSVTLTRATQSRQKQMHVLGHDFGLSEVRCPTRATATPFFRTP